MTVSTHPKLGLLLICHGSPVAPWNDAHSAIVDRVDQALQACGASDVFFSKKMAFLEFVEPCVASACEQMEAEGVERIIAIPLLISISSHSERDIPNCLNIRVHPDQDPDMRRYIGRVPVTLASTMDHSDMLMKVLSENAKGLSKCPEEESVLIVSHGNGCEHFWGHMNARIAAEVSKETGIPSEKVKWAYIETGRSAHSQEHLKNSLESLIESTHCSRVLILAAFNGVGGKGFLARVGKGLGGRGMALPSSAELVGDDTWLQSPHVTEWALKTALNAAKCATGKKAHLVLEGEEKNLVPPYNPPFYLTRDCPMRKK